jgi:uncharacterized protein (DUF2147 family)
MSVKVLTFAAAFASLVVAAGHAIAAEPTPLGLWQAVDDDTKQPIGWFLIRDHSGVYDGIIAKMFLKPGEDPNEACVQCKDDRHNHPWLGLEIIRGMKPEGESKYGSGTILDPRDGKIYKAKMTVSPDGQSLTMRGYWGISLLGKDEIWSRLPDTAMASLDPAIVAKYLPAVAAAQAAANKPPVAPIKPPVVAKKSASPPLPK